MLCNFLHCGVLARTTLLMAASVCIAKGDLITASLYTAIAPTGSAVTVVNLTGITAPSQSYLSESGLTIAFSSVGSNQGVVKGTTGGVHAIPVAGVSGGLPEYLTGNYGSALTLNAANSGNYLSTGTGTITITFSTPQTALALLWGSIDSGSPGNEVKLNDAANYTVTGAMVQTAASGFVSNGFQGPGGSAYVLISTTTPFTTATFTSSVVSFEFAGIVGFGEPPAVPEPSSMLLAATGIGLAFVALRRRRSKNTLFLR